MRRVKPFVLVSGVLAFLVVPAGGATNGPKPEGQRALSVWVCVGTACAPTLKATDASGATVSLKATADGLNRPVDRWPAPMKYAGTVTAASAGISCPPTCTAASKFRGKIVRLIARPTGSNGYGYYDFGRWEGVHCDEGQASRTCTIHVSGNPHARAFFYVN